VEFIDGAAVVVRKRKWSVRRRIISCASDRVMSDSFYKAPDLPTNNNYV